MSDCDPRIRKKLMGRYEHRCQVCGIRIVLPDGRYYLEGHHIHPRAKNGLDHPRNVLVLCPNHHLAFDRHALAIHPGSGGRLVCCDHRDRFHGERITLHPSHKLSRRCLTLAWEAFQGARK